MADSSKNKLTNVNPKRHNQNKLKPYPLKKVKELLKSGHYVIKLNALESADDDFNWGPAEIKKCLLKLNSRHYVDDRAKNHYYKTEPHTRFPNTKMDYYKAKKIMEGFDIYTHFYIRSSDDTLVISSFKEL
jgi:hypothetical protein